MCAVDVSAPGEKEIDHEFPYQSQKDRELKRRVKLGQKYQGVSIDRRNGLTIVETDGEGEGAKVVLNSKELSFYDAGGGRVLYFDPASGTYKFLGELNVNDKFKVDKYGNVTMAGSINLSDGSITWGGKGPVKYQFSADGSDWHDTMAANDKYRRDSLDGGTTWGEAYQFRGTDGSNGSDATVNRKNVEIALKYSKSLGSSFMAVDSVGSPIIYGGKIFGSEIYAGGAMEANGINGIGSVISLTPTGIQMYNNDNDTSLTITSTKLPSLGTVTMLSNQSRPLYLTSKDVVIGHSAGTSDVVGLQVGANETIFAGNINLGDAKITNWGDNHPTAVFA